ncbi:MAG: type II toxin-antitoxin system HicB family antitoxin [Candidatus Sungiibacteriota bacterium]
MQRSKSKKTIAVVDTSYGSHRVVFERDERKGYVATAPDLPGVITWGQNLAEAKKMVREAIELCVECMAEARIAAEKTAHPMIVRRPRERILV